MYQVLLAHAGRVHQSNPLALPLDHGVDGVTGGSCNIGDDGALLSGKAVGKRGLANVWPAHDGKREHVLVILKLVL